MAEGIRKKLAKAVASRNQIKGKVAPAQRKACTTSSDKADAKCSKGVKKEVVTSVGS